MVKIIFICHGNICRSPMAEMIMAHLVRERGLEKEFEIASAATSTEELGNGIYPPARSELAAHGIPLIPHRARQITRKDAEYYDAIICMDRYNLRNLRNMLGNEYAHKIRMLNDSEIDDPWYTDRFDITYEQILSGCEKLLEYHIGSGDIYG